MGFRIQMFPSRLEIWNNSEFPRRVPNSQIRFEPKRYSIIEDRAGETQRELRPDTLSGRLVIFTEKIKN